MSELGQLVRGDETFEHEVPNYVEAALWLIESELCRVMGNITQVDYKSPFQNYGSYTQYNGCFCAQGYNWDEEAGQEWNFKWKDFRLRWYKYCGRGMTMNRELTPLECAAMLDECLKEIRGKDRK